MEHWAKMGYFLKLQKKSAFTGLIVRWKPCCVGQGAFETGHQTKNVLGNNQDVRVCVTLRTIWNK